MNRKLNRIVAGTVGAIALVAPSAAFADDITIVDGACFTLIVKDADVSTSPPGVSVGYVYYKQHQPVSQCI